MAAGLVWRRADGIAAARGAGWAQAHHRLLSAVYSQQLCGAAGSGERLPGARPTLRGRMQLYTKRARQRQPPGWLRMRLRRWEAASSAAALSNTAAAKVSLATAAVSSAASASWQGSRRAGVVPSALPAALPGTETLPDGANPAQAQTPAAAAPPRQRLPPVPLRQRRPPAPLQRLRRWRRQPQRSR